MYLLARVRQLGTVRDRLCERMRERADGFWEQFLLEYEFRIAKHTHRRTEFILSNADDGTQQFLGKFPTDHRSSLNDMFLAIGQSIDSRCQYSFH